MNDSKFPDAVASSPAIHKSIFENSLFRVIQVEIKPGEKTPLHFHPDNVSYIISGGKLKFSKEDGSFSEVEVAAGRVAPGAGVHAVENIGETIVKTIQVELIK